MPHDKTDFKYASHWKDTLTPAKKALSGVCKMIHLILKLPIERVHEEKSHQGLWLCPPCPLVPRKACLICKEGLGRESVAP